MDKALYKNVANSTAHRVSREGIAMHVLANPVLANDLITLALDVNDKNHFKACWILEIVLEKNILLISERLNDFCTTFLLWTNQSALRSVAKICLFCATSYEER